MTIQDKLDILWQGIQRGDHDPQALRQDLSIDDSYRIQLALLDRLEENGEQQVGWKVGLTAKAIQAQVDFHEPVFGFLLKSGHIESPATLKFDQLISPGIENELCITLGQSLVGPNVTFEQARAAITSISPAIEIIEKRSAPPMNIPLMLADNGQQKAFVTGLAIPLGDLDLNLSTVDVNFNGKKQETAKGAAVDGTSVKSVQWLANKLAQFGRQLDAGQVIMSGSFTRQYDVAEGDLVETVFSPAGTVSVHFV